jgi:hypothetical protein
MLLNYLCGFCLHIQFHLTNKKQQKITNETSLTNFDTQKND